MLFLISTASQDFEVIGCEYRDMVQQRQVRQEKKTSDHAVAAGTRGEFSVLAGESKTRPLRKELFTWSADKDAVSARRRGDVLQ